MNTANLPLDGTCIELLALESELKAQGVEAVFRPFRPGEGGSFAEAHDQPLRLLVHESDLETAHAIAAELAPESESE